VASLVAGALDSIAGSQFGDALRGYDKQEVRSFLASVAAELRAAAHGDASPPATPDGDEALVIDDEADARDGDVGVAVRSARDIGVAIRAAAERDAESMRAIAAEEAAMSLEAAWFERDAVAAERAALTEEEAVWAARQEEPARLTEVAHAELEAARLLQAEAATAAAAAAASAGAQAAARLTEADQDLELAQSLVTEARKEAAELRSSAEAWVWPGRSGAVASSPCGRSSSASSPPRFDLGSSSVGLSGSTSSTRCGRASTTWHPRPTAGMATSTISSHASSTPEPGPPACGEAGP